MKREQNRRGIIQWVAVLFLLVGLIAGPFL